MILRGLLIISSGFFFIFSPGLVLAWVARRAGPPDRSLLLFGVAAWLIATPAGLFVTSLLRQLLPGSGREGALATLLDSFFGALTAGVFLALAIALILKWKTPEPDASWSGGLALGLGAGLVAHVFTGLGFIGAGFRILFGRSAAPAGEALATVPIFLLSLGLLAVILFRLAFIAVSGMAGLLIGRDRTWRGLGAAVLAYTAFPWLLAALRAVLGEAQDALDVGGISVVSTSLTLAYFTLSLAVSLAWLRGPALPDTGRAHASPEKSRSGTPASPPV